MKYLAAVSCLLLISLYGAHAVSEELKDLIEDASQKCSKIHGDEETLSNFFHHHQLGDSHDSMCVVACALREMGVLMDKQLDAARCKALNRMKYNDPAMVKKADEITDICADKVPTDLDDECEVAKQIIECYMSESEKANLPLPSLR